MLIMILRKSTNNHFFFFWHLDSDLKVCNIQNKQGRIFYQKKSCHFQHLSNNCHSFSCQKKTQSCYTALLNFFPKWDTWKHSAEPKYLAAGENHSASRATWTITGVGCSSLLCGVPLEAGDGDGSSAGAQLPRKSKHARLLHHSHHHPILYNTAGKCS